MAKKWPPSWVLALIQGLPQGCRFHASRHGEDYRGFDYTVAAIANLYDLNGAVALRKKWKATMHYPRPGAKRGGGSSLAARAPGRR